MNGDPRVSPPGDSRPCHLVLYDGACGLCNHLVRGALRADRDGVLGFAPLQSPMGRRLLGQLGTTATFETFHVLAHYDSAAPRLLSKSAAALFLLGVVGWTRTSRLLATFPSAMLDWCYDRVAANRHRVFRRHDACLPPAPEHRDRFLDV